MRHVTTVNAGHVLYCTILVLSPMRLLLADRDGLDSLVDRLGALHTLCVDTVLIDGALSMHARESDHERCIRVGRQISLRDSRMC